MTLYGYMVPTMSEKEPPGLIRRSRNLAGAVARVGKAVITGDSVFCGTFDAEQRMNICEVCELFRASDRICTHEECGCYLDAKVTLETEHCPMAKWPGDINH